ncbi:rCG22167 [Rattus norvegicus]|uniref:RCG22167 n=1 Tax=Rattus norvegicus TaxID=10116 RepID=A6INC6_RAT|nr:rCG22167 [Rattus norvegicus]
MYIVCVCMELCAPKCGSPWKPEAADRPGAGHTGSCEPRRFRSSGGSAYTRFSVPWRRGPGQGGLS